VRTLVHDVDPPIPPAARPGHPARWTYIRRIDGAATESRLTATAQRAVDADGGAERWRAATAVTPTMALSGLLFRVKSRRPPAERQRYVFDRETGLIDRYDYVPEIVAPPPLPWVANAVVERGSADGFAYEATRRVTIAPSNGKPWKRPEIVAMRFWDYSVS
jgi:hypothetical protein